MNKSLIFKMVICLFGLGISLYSYIEKQNEVTSLKIEIPKVAKEIQDYKAEIKKIQYEVKMFENPAYLMQLLSQPEYAHLKHPFVEDVLNIPEGIALSEEKAKDVFTLAK
jgi:hypothetical protein